MKSRQDFLYEQGFDFEKFNLDNEYSAKSLLLAMHYYAHQECNQIIDRLVLDRDKEIQHLINENAALKLKLSNLINSQSDNEKSKKSNETYNR